MDRFPMYASAMNLYRFGTERAFRWSDPEARIESPVWRFYWNRKGKARFSIGGKCVDLEGERVLLIPPNCPFERLAVTEMDHFFIHFTIRASFELAESIYEIRGPESIDFEVLGRLFAACEDGSQGEPCSVLLLQSLLVGVLASFDSSRKRKDPFELEARAAVDAMLDAGASVDQLTAATLARRLMISEKTLSRRFAASLGTSPGRYLTQARIEAAALDLLFSQSSIEKVADRYGFCDRYYFTRVFKKRYGVGPAGYRSLARSG
ncbi:MAG: AraC family transcriptional regulator [Verrucomicrobiota bacterium]